MKSLTFGCLAAAIALAGCQPTDTPAPSVAPASAATVATAAASPEPANAGEALSRSQPVDLTGASNFVDDCNLDNVDGGPLLAQTVELSKSKPHTFQGWLVNKTSSNTGENLALVVQGVGDVTDTWRSSKVVRISYPDIVKARGYQPSMTDSGFSFENLSLSELANGNYHVFVVLANPPGLAYCDPGRQIKVVD